MFTGQTPLVVHTPPRKMPLVTPKTMLFSLRLKPFLGYLDVFTFTCAENSAELQM